MVKLTDKKIEWAVEQVINNGESTELCCCDIWCLKEKITAFSAVLYGKQGPMLDKALDLEYFETLNVAFNRKMRCENTLGMFIE